MLDKIPNASFIKTEGEMIFFHGAGAAELMSNATFIQTAFLSLTKKLPDVRTTQMLDCVLIALMLETESSPPELCAKIYAKTGAKINSAIGAAVGVMDEKHGLHIQECMQILKNSIRDMQEIGLVIDEQAEIAVQQSQDRGSLIPGYSTGSHDTDIRIDKLIAKVKELGFEGNYIKLARSISAAYKTIFGLDMPLNIDGLAAAVFLETGLNPECGPALFILSKLPFLFSTIGEIKWKPA